MRNMKCSKCGSKVKSNYNLCPNCGERIIIKNENKTKKKILNKKLIFCLVILLIITCGMFVLFNDNDNIDKIKKSVVKINVYDKSGELLQTGSGFIVFKKNILVTNAHVITGGITVDAISEDDKKLFVNGAIYYNQDEDIAILKLNNQNDISPLKISKKYNSGDKVLAIGSPLGIKNSVSDGIISNILEDGTIQHTAPISSGSSGGALVNSKGQVIGMNTASLIAGQNMNLSIPINQIEKAFINSKNNKVKKIEKIQYGTDSDIKSIMLNNNAGKQISKLICQETNNKYGIFNKIKDTKSIPILKMLYENKTYYSDILIISGGDDIEESEDGTRRTLIKETTVPEIIILKLNSRDDDIKDFTYNILKSRAEELYDIDSGCFWYCNSQKYLNALKNPKIGFVNDYAYSIISTNSDFITKLESQIKLLP